MSYPRSVKLFRPWAQAMVEGATVDKPDYGKKTSKLSSSASKRSSSSFRRKKRRRRRRRKRNAET